MNYEGPIVTRKEAMALGLSRYFTNKPCHRGHIAERRAPGGRCVDCVLIGDAKIRKENNRKKRREDLDYRGRERAIEYARQQLPEVVKKKKDRRANQRFKVLTVIGKGVVACVKCGCDDVSLLEINHINGGGNREIKNMWGNRYVYYNQILSGTRSADDLELTCGACNTIHRMEMKAGRSLPFYIKWQP